MSAKEPKKVQRSKICYVCKASYLPAAFEDHIIICKQQWEERESLKPIGQRKKIPDNPEEVTVSPVIQVRAKTPTAKTPAPKAEVIVEEPAVPRVLNADGLCECPHCKRGFNNASFDKYEYLY